jgi:energy-coupling factor transporter ATP-binding protein EcfA2
MGDTETLLELLSRQLVDAGATEEVSQLVRAAYAGDQQLQAVLDGKSWDPGVVGDPARNVGPNAVYLESIRVAGFRGVGQAPVMRLTPSAGLTLIVGRNGSGKSSFAEALELVLTGDSARWAGHSAVFREGWRNLHSGTPCAIEVRVRQDGVPSPMKITRSWADSATDPDDATVTIDGDIDTAPWKRSLLSYRPFLTANDLGRLVTSTPSDLYDALAPILGLEPVMLADGRLTAAKKQLDDRIGEVRSRLAEIRSTLTTADDDRARRASAILASRNVDLDALDALLSESAPTADPSAGACQRLVAFEIPSVADALSAADGLRTAAARVTAIAAGRAGSAERAARVLEAALTWHDGNGDGACPVCRTGILDHAWHLEAADELARLREEAVSAREAQQQLEAARQAASTIATADRKVPEFALTQAAGLPEDIRAASVAAAAAWRSLSTDANVDELAAHLSTRYAEFHGAVTAVQTAAADWLRDRHEAWRPHAAALQTWLESKRASAQVEAAAAQVKAARTFLKGAIDSMRVARLAPFAAHSQQIWEELRQESNVELSGMRLAGSATRRKVSFPATVDGTATSAMAVMSQGELQALGLAVFLPRACAEESPFRFVIIDDPVHSMDPSKVDGLARVLSTLAQSRQVVVFTHDNRLPEAIRRLDIPATIWEVVRRNRSVVDIRKNDDQVKRYLDDAFALARTTELDDTVRRPVVAGFCRAALEAAGHERIRRDLLERGESHSTVERRIDDARTLTDTFALALLGDTSQGTQVLSWLNRHVGSWAATVFKACQREVHGVGAGSLDTLVNDARRLADKVRTR